MKKEMSHLYTSTVYIPDGANPSTAAFANENIVFMKCESGPIDPKDSINPYVDNSDYPSDKDDSDDTDEKSD